MTGATNPQSAKRYSRPRSVLVVGGSGAFGSRLVDGLVATTDLDIVVAGRDLAKAERIAQAQPGGRVAAIRLDRAAIGTDALRSSGADIVVDAAGPFQRGEPRLARAAIAAQLHYVDLCDARDFVAGFRPELDIAARAAGIFALTGASTTPALSNAALDAITQNWRRVSSIAIAVVPGNRAPRGLSVMQAILSYVGRPVRVRLDGGWQDRPGWSLLSRMRVPGLGRRWASLCETPDLDILSERFPDARTVLFRAGLELPILHLGLWLASLPVRFGVVPSLVPFAGVFLKLASWFHGFGSDRGGMVVAAFGRDADDRPVEASWSLVAEAGDGPFVPTLPALAVIRRIADATGTPIEPGARPCVAVLSLAEIEAEMSRHRIRTQVDVAYPQPLFRQALGPAFETMPAAVRMLHDAAEETAFAGEAAVERGSGFFSNLVADFVGLPKPMDEGPVRVTIRPHSVDGVSTERWTRDFAGRRFRSRMGLATGGAGHGLMSERFGPFTMDLEVTAGPAGLDIAVTGWRCGPVALPRALRPTTEACERVDDTGRFRFDVSLFLPLVGRLVRYRGWLLPQSDTARESE